LNTSFCGSMRTRAVSLLSMFIVHLLGFVRTERTVPEPLLYGLDLATHHWTTRVRPSRSRWDQLACLLVHRSRAAASPARGPLPYREAKGLQPVSAAGGVAGTGVPATPACSLTAADPGGARDVALHAGLERSESAVGEIH